MNMPYQQPMMNYTPNYGAYQYNPTGRYFAFTIYPKIHMSARMERQQHMADRLILWGINSIGIELP